MTANLIPAPALRGDDPLGFLASVGVMALSWVGAIPDVRLGWSPGLTPHAEFASRHLVNTDELALVLTKAARVTKEKGGVLPAAPVDLPRPTQGANKDPNRMSPSKAADLFAHIDTTREPSSIWAGRWTAALFGQTVVDDQGRVRLTSLYAPFGKMALRTSLYDKTYQAMESVDGPADALTGWIRTDPGLKYDGANLDAKAKRNSTFVTDGQPANQGAPSPTWLAVMSPLLMPVVESRGRSGGIGWQAHRLRADLTRRSLVWPIWDGHLDAIALQSLLGHPALEVTGEAENVRVPAARQLRGLGVRAVYGSSRSTQSQGDGPLAPARRLWPSNLSDGQRFAP